MQTQALESPSLWVTLDNPPNLSHHRNGACGPVEGLGDGRCDVPSVCLCPTRSEGSVLVT